ncbi:C2H2-type zinc finger protein [Aspergillus clavatus NRRL 1]|uniref:C2H2 transcription factor, putative n=1 Tax=Aspergillus clavatus (strain ATCC 1007 / CBS 513.65 / DSM 816 / NCTC 3887 / NRRL 1 / QM 1276 / 107) TaxID=344612 RepID=A1CK82_ASPCL|nr:C2H2 transcription factor, putative [Aspergillus clavatus NRRL 1]EAW09556.1 C2H2 transcription factor, putative [Aspergillus clavatus NRRL 1]
MTSFLPVNNSSSPQTRMMEEATTPATPRPYANNVSAAEDTTPHTMSAASEDSTPRNVQHTQNDSTTRTRTASGHNGTSHGDSDAERDGSDHETEPGGNAPPSKKKKGQRFYCTDFPPCNLSFTRSEHLARHIRKHTGERPFQCHCSRRFSRLDNLRQHAQTVHVNEEIPGDSLAATGTRFQRQIRTDRVRPQGRARAGTGGSQGTHSRGHSRNLSTSSIASTTSTYSQPPDFRRRPPPLIMANDGSARARLSLDTMGDMPTTPPGQGRGMPGPAIAGGSPYTPSHFFAAGGNGSPHMASAVPAAPHMSGFWDGKTAARRLSVPTGANPFITQQPNNYPPSIVTTATPTTAAYPPPGGVFASPASSTRSFSRDEAAYSTADADLRRRTWHPSTYSALPRPGTSGLSHYQTPDTVPAPISSSGSTEQHTRLPGIESFDKVVSHQRPLTPPVRRPSPMQIDNHGKPSPSYTLGGGFNYAAPTNRPAPPISGPGHRRGHVSWDMSLHTNLTGLHIRDKPQPRDASHWSQQTIAEIQNVSSRPSSSYQQQVQESRGITGHSAYDKMPGWYGSNTSGSQATRTSPEDSSSSEGVHTPSTASLEYHPAIVHNNGYIESHQPSIASDTSHSVRPPLPGPSMTGQNR